MPDTDRIGTLVDHDLAEQLGVRGIRATRSTEQLSDLVALYEKGALRIAIRARYRLDQIAEAHRTVEHGHGRGKVVIEVSGALPAALSTLG